MTAPAVVTCLPYFFVDLPESGEREEIWRIHIQKRGRKPGKFNLAKLAEITEGFTGAEIEQAVIDALYECFDAGCDLGMKNLNEAVERTVPLAVTMSEKIRALREWSRNRARPAGGEKEKPREKAGRRIAA